MSDDPIEKSPLDIKEQSLRIEELELNVMDLKKSDFRKVSTWTGVIAIAVAIMSVIGQGVVYEIKSAKAERQLDSAYLRKNVAQKSADSILAHLKATRDSIEYAKIELQNFQANAHTAKLQFDSLTSAYAKNPAQKGGKENGRVNQLLKDTRQTLNTQIEGAPKSNSRDNTTIASPIVPDDPQKGQWGRLAERDGRKMTATVEERPNHSFKIVITVKSTDPAKPLTGSVTFHLHNTFRNQNPVVEVGDNEAVLVLIVVGSFTVGAETDNGRTKLELDLAEVSGVSDYFKNH
jgi:hypothetical protein